MDCLVSFCSVRSQMIWLKRFRHQLGPYRPTAIKTSHCAVMKRWITANMLYATFCDGRIMSFPIIAPSHRIASLPRFAELIPVNFPVSSHFTGCILSVIANWLNELNLNHAYPTDRNPFKPTCFERFRIQSKSLWWENHFQSSPNASKKEKKN